MSTVYGYALVRPLKAIALVCGCLVLLLLVLALSSSDWLLTDGWRQGLFTHCTDQHAALPLPFDLPFEPGCHAARHTAYIRAAQALCVATLLLDALACLFTALGLCSASPAAKRRYYRAAALLASFALFSLLAALLVYPICFSQELERSNRVLWQFGWAYGVGWGAALFLCADSVLLLCDRETEQVYYHERTVVDDQRY